ncbi:alpha/beta hydrolase family protein [Paracerasibacillus soli]|uniref:Alpha/beta hydrolase n=2 Tax=Paracerasibacillus soli TaxID=480284 RepID=A0ABU5CY34_9BACI|nr:hypothetical protein [Virgibacillus soli]MDY0410333.1 hypothetical protein [Virgibacillus soli]
MLAAQKADVDLYISIAGAGRTIDHILHDQLKDQLPPALLKESDEIMQKLKEGEQVTKVSPELDSLFRTSAQPFLTSWMSYDPTKEIRKLKMPVMIINGTHDVQVNVHEAERLNEAKSDAKLLLVDKMNHILKEAPDNYEENIATYSNPDLPLADGLMNGIITFLKENHFIGS